MQTDVYRADRVATCSQEGSSVEEAIAQDFENLFRAAGRPTPLANVAEAATYVNISTRSLDRLARELPRVRVAGRWYFLYADLDAWLASKRVVPHDVKIPSLVRSKSSVSSTKASEEARRSLQEMARWRPGRGPSRGTRKCSSGE